jgi:hypothetical protein
VAAVPPDPTTPVPFPTEKCDAGASERTSGLERGIDNGKGEDGRNLAESGLTALKTESVESCRSLCMDTADLRLVSLVDPAGNRQELTFDPAARSKPSRGRARLQSS